MKKIFIGFFAFVILLALGIPIWVVKGLPDEPLQISTTEPMVTVLNVQTGENMVLPLEEYLIGVTAAEMPANFEVDALKAQAAAARTYTVKRMFQFGAAPSEKHGEAEICTDPTHCQAWVSKDELLKKWGKIKFYLYYDKIETAVKMTRGQVITYQNALIDPVYHSSCGGTGTENSEDVWTDVIPYLRSVDCSLEYKEDENVFTVDIDKEEVTAAFQDIGREEEAAQTMTETGAKTVQEIESALDRRLLAAKGEPAIEPVKRSARGRLQEVKVFGQTISGSNLRQKLGLTSTLVTWKTAGSTITFTSVGKGHAVGMCQYGANGMALVGMDYNEIIKHYYTGVKLQKLKY